MVYRSFVKPFQSNFLLQVFNPKIGQLHVDLKDLVGGSGNHKCAGNFGFHEMIENVISKILSRTNCTVSSSLYNFSFITLPPQFVLCWSILFRHDKEMYE
ncbi:hypothetical protein RHGRI_032939 [Rhododendron griersonianum]|uniref:Uncharacterized protein n=1 Tax=Rhododendron griersonianum TaxID=479676 RepID=A0AAV6IIK0_9ERIC|nr:hypothetical protein RHGRI_032939 [Rhododendron griersonianum]